MAGQNIKPCYWLLVVGSLEVTLSTEHLWSQKGNEGTFLFLLWVSFVLWVKTSGAKHMRYEFLPGWDVDKKSIGDEWSYPGVCLSWWGSLCHWIWNEVLASWTNVFFGSYLPFVVAFCLWKVFTAPRKTACGSSLKKKKGKRIVPDIKCFK